MEKISVIIPAYNCEKYLEQCVRSVLAQIYQNLEIIIVNDGSTDTTGKIMEQLAQEDKRIKTLHKENTGVGETRNVGLSLATGDYICFIDSDDWMDPNHIDDLYQVLTKTDSDIAITNFSQYNDEKGSYNIHLSAEDYYEKVYTPEEWFAFQYGQPHFLSSCFVVLWGKLYKRELFEDVLYPNKHADDDYTTWKLYLLSERIVYINAASYVYRINSSSMTQVGNQAHIFSAEAVEERLSLLTLLGFDVSREIEAFKWRSGVNEKAMLEQGDIAGYKDMKLKRKLMQKYRK